MNRPLIRSNSRWPALAASVAVITFLLTACEKTALTKPQLRAITGELVAGAQKATGHLVEVTIRSESQPSNSISQNNPAIDNIYVPLADSSQTTALQQAVTQIASGHSLSVRETSSGGVIRFDLFYNGNRTHTIHAATSLATRDPGRSRQGGRNPQLAIIIDDVGHDQGSANSILALSFPLTVSVLPYLPLSTTIAEQAYRRGDQVLLHLPMEAESDGAEPETRELRVGMNVEQVDSTLAGMLESVPHAAGVNNHQGSRATADQALMQSLMPALRERRLFFIDSRTTTATVAYSEAKRSGIPAASRKVFLDDTLSREAIISQLDLAGRDAIRDGSAIAIGHPHSVTITALGEGIPQLQTRGIRLVFASDLVR